MLSERYARDSQRAVELDPGGLSVHVREREGLLLDTTSACLSAGADVLGALFGRVVADVSHPTSAQRRLGGALALQKMVRPMRVHADRAKKRRKKPPLQFWVFGRRARASESSRSRSRSRLSLSLSLSLSLGDFRGNLQAETALVSRFALCALRGAMQEPQRPTRVYRFDEFRIGFRYRVDWCRVSVRRVLKTYSRVSCGFPEHSRSSESAPGNVP